MESRRLALLLLFCALSTALASGPASAAKVFRGPVEVAVLEVLDGDTFVAEALVWPGHSVRVNVRIRGVDAPEMKARCDAERAAAEKAREALAALFGQGPIAISNISGAKYYGRVLADVTMPDGTAVAPLLLRRNLVLPYSGGRREPWCG